MGREHLQFQDKLDAMTKRIDKIYADRLDGLLAEDDFDRLYKKLCDERQRLRDQLREAQSRSEHEARMPLWLGSWRKGL